MLLSSYKVFLLKSEHYVMRTAVGSEERLRDLKQFVARDMFKLPQACHRWRLRLYRNLTFP